jgi:hypothetical protein
MAKRRSYRTDRLRRRRRSAVERSQAWILYALAAGVAFAAVLGAWYVATRWSGEEKAPPKRGYLAALELTVPGSDDPVAAGLVVNDGEGGDPAVYLIPPDLLLEGPNGEYVFAGDAIASGTFEEDLERILDASLDVVYRIPVSEFGRWAGSADVAVSLKEPVSVDLPSGVRTYKDGERVPTADIPSIFSATAVNRRSLVALQTALLDSALEAAALQPEEVRAGLGGVAGSSPPGGGPGLPAIVEHMTSGGASVEILPSGSRTAEGQFAFVPDAAGIMSEITRRAPGYESDVTVQVRNGSGVVGAGAAALERLTSLDVNLPAAVNADSFSYRHTQILAGPDTLRLARDVRAILGRGVVLDGPDVPPGTIEVIVGADFKPPSPESKDQP